MDLVIVESPNKVHTIKSYLGTSYSVQATVGGFRDLVEYGKYNLGVDIDSGNFEAVYEVKKGKQTIIDKIQKDVDNADTIYLATDPDREGEAISYHLTQVLKFRDDQKVCRVEFHEITKNHILEALKNTRDVDMNLFYSQEARRIMDRIIGYRLSYFLQSRTGLSSAGRVQSATLELICSREDEIKNFVPEYWYDVYATYKQDFRAKLVRFEGKEFKFDKEELAKKAVESFSNSLTLVDIKEEENTKKGLPALTTSSLLQQAFIEFKYDAKKTMKIAQELFEGKEIEGKHTGLITYMRTDSTRLSNLFVHSGKKLIEERFGPEYKYHNDDFSYFKLNDAASQDAHEAIRPTDLRIPLATLKEELAKDEYNIYTLIYYRALAALTTPATIKQTTYTFKDGDYEFEDNKEEVIFGGNLDLKKAIFKEKVEKCKDNELSLNDVVSVDEYKIEENQTKPPYRYNEGSLVEKMKVSGIGRPSTYATTIDNLKTKRYVNVEKGYLYPSEDGILHNKTLRQYFPENINVEYTAYLEDELDYIAQGSQQEKEVLTRLNDKFVAEFKPAIDNAKVITYDEKCPTCGAPLIRKFGRNGSFMCCSNYPECRFTRSIDVETKKVCPKCKTGHLIEKFGKYGKYYVCSNQPECDYKMSAKFQYSKWKKK